MIEMRQKLLIMLKNLLSSKRFRSLLYVPFILIIIVGLFTDFHPHFWWQKIPGFDAIYGFFGCILLVVVSKLLGHYWLSKREDYYD